MNRDRKIETVSVVALAGLGAAFLYNIVLCGKILKLGYPFNSFLFKADEVCSDFFTDITLNSALNPYSQSTQALNSIYLPFGNIVEWLFSLPSPKIALNLFLATALVFLFWAGCTALKRETAGKTVSAVTLLALFSYPAMYLLSRGNFELFVFIFLYLSVYFYRRGKFSASALLLALSMSYKPFSAVFLFLFISDKRYRHALAVAAGSVALSFVCALFLQGGVIDNLRQLASNMGQYQREYVFTFYGMVFGHSLFGAAKLAGYLFCGNFPAPPSAAFVNAYFVAALVAAAGIVYFVFREKALWKKTALLVSAMTLLPFVSGDYRLIHFLIPLFLFIDEKEDSGFDLAYAALFGLLLVPKHWYYFYGTEISVSALLTPLLILALLWCIIGEQLRGALPHKTEVV